MIKQFTFNTHSFSVFQKSKEGQTACGDSYWLEETETGLMGVLADGLGSGEDAYLASKMAVDTVKRYQELPLEEIVRQVNKEQSAYRGVVLSIIKYNKNNNQLSYCGVGNIRLKLMSPESVVQLRSKNGFLSGRPVDFDVHQVRVESNTWLIMYSDGVDFRTKELPHLYQLLVHESDQAVKDYLRTTTPKDNKDDMTLLIGKPN